MKRDDETLAGRERSPHPELVRRTLAGSEASDPGDDKPLIPPGLTLGRYVVLEPIGSGAMGIVCAAYDPELDRKVALKLLHSDSDAPDATAGRARLVREAQAMAQLSHPNVITVHDVGTLGDEVFIAMEFIDGQTLTEWTAADDRTWQEVVAVFLQAGAGLVAAHAAGIVHRDFKPDNVLIASDGRVCVVDFGLARPAGETVKDPAGERSASTVSSQGSLHDRLTRTGALMGTPAYMAPEQFLGSTCDARSDQFSFCVALYEALYRERPFGEARLAALAAEMLEHGVRDPPAGSRVPQWLRRTVMRGLSVVSSERYPSMDELLADLGRDPLRVRRRRLLVGAVSIVALASVGGMAYAQHQLDQLCSGASTRLAGVWDETVRAETREAFAAVDLPFADDSWQRMADVLDDYGERWVDTFTDACEATRVRGEQSEDLLDRRMLCLDRRLQSIRALSALFAEPDETIVERAVRATLQLPAIEPCSDAETLMSAVEPPQTPDLRARVAEIRADLARIEARRLAGLATQTLDDAQRAQDAADESGYVPLAAEAAWVRSSVLLEAGRFETVREALESAIVAAAEARDDPTAANAWASLLYVVGSITGEGEEGVFVAKATEAAVVRAGGHPQLRARFLVNRGLLFLNQAKYDAAQQDLEQALGLREQLYGPTHPYVADVTNNLGLALRKAGKLDEARVQFDRTLQIYEDAFGTDHPMVAAALTNLGLLLQSSRQHAKAQAMHERALRILEAARGPDHLNVMGVLRNLGNALRDQSDFEGSREKLERSLSIGVATLGAEHVSVAGVHNALGSTEVAAKNPQKGLEHFEIAVRLFENALGPDHPSLAYPLANMGNARIELGAPKAAIAPLNRALDIRAANPGDGVHHAEILSILARATWDVGDDRAKARELATKSHEQFRSLGRVTAATRVEKWLADHGDDE